MDISYECEIWTTTEGQLQEGVFRESFELNLQWFKNQINV